VLNADGARAGADYGRVMSTTAPFPLAAIEAHTVMSPGLVSCPPCAALTEVATLMAIHQVHAVLVDPGAPRLITARDVVRAALAGATGVNEISLPEAPSVLPEETLLAAAERMIQAGEGHVVVRDGGDGRARGVLSSFDVVAVLADHEPRLARIVRPAPARPAISGGPLNRHEVRDVMHRGIFFCPSTTPLADVARVLVERRTHMVMVWRDDALGFITDMDLVAAAVGGAPLATAGELAGSGLALIPANAPLDRAASLVAEAAAGHVVATDASGFPIGVLSTLDVVGAMGSE
jgi:CBS domain-containing protein